VDKKAKTALIIGGLAVAAYLIYRWYQNKQSNQQNQGQLGTNLNSVAPALIGGSSGPMSGLQYYAGTTDVYVTNPVTQPASTSTGGSTGSGGTTGSSGGGRKWGKGGGKTGSGGLGGINPGGPNQPASGNVQTYTTASTGLSVQQMMQNFANTGSFTG
jgi:hypothetical protein